MPALYVNFIIFQQQPTQNKNTHTTKIDANAPQASKENLLKKKKVTMKNDVEEKQKENSTHFHNVEFAFWTQKMLFSFAAMRFRVRWRLSPSDLLSSFWHVT